MQTATFFLLGILYTILFCWFIYRKNKNGNYEIKLPVAFLIIAFIVKAAAGIFYGYIYSHYFPESDSWNYFNESLTDYHTLLQNPSQLFSYTANTGNITDFFSTANNAFWSNAGENILIKLLSVLNVFSDGNYYVSCILYNIISFTGLYFLYKVVAKNFTANKVLIFIIIFFLPSNLFWSSGIDKEGLVAFFSGLLIFHVDKCITSNRLKFINILFALFGFCGILLMRNATALVFIPAIFGWYISGKFIRRKYLAFAISYLIFIGLFFLSTQFQSSLNMPLKLAEKQHQFLELKGNSLLTLTSLQPTLKSYLIILPQAFNHVFLRPYINEISSPFHLLTFLENYFVIAIVLISIIFNTKEKIIQLTKPFPLFLLSISVTGYFLIGYTVPFTGAIIRYKALYTIIFLLPFINILSEKISCKFNSFIKKHN